MRAIVDNRYLHTQMFYELVKVYLLGGSNSKLVRYFYGEILSFGTKSRSAKHYAKVYIVVENYSKNPERLTEGNDGICKLKL